MPPTSPDAVIRLTLTLAARRVVAAGDTALVVHDWQLRGPLPDGSPVRQEGRAVDVLRVLDAVAAPA